MGVSATNRTYSLRRTEPQSHLASSRPRRTSAPQKAQQRTFLNFRFADIPVSDLNPTSMRDVTVTDGESRICFGNVAVDMKTNLSRLRQCAIAFCNANGGNVPEMVNPNPLKELIALYNCMNECCAERNEIAIDYNPQDNELVFVEYALMLYPEFRCAFVPVKFISMLPPEYADFYCQLFSLTRATMSMPMPDEHFDFSYAIGEWGDELLEDFIEEDESYKEYMDSYQHGEAKELFERIQYSVWHKIADKSKETVEYLAKLIDDAPTPALKELTKIAVDGIDLMRDECIETYRQSPDSCNMEDFDCNGEDESLPLERLMCFCYHGDEDDPITSNALDCLNNDGGNFEQEQLYCSRLVTPEYDKTLVGTDFPEKWFEWIEKLLPAITKYENEQANENAK